MVRIRKLCDEISRGYKVMEGGSEDELDRGDMFNMCGHVSNMSMATACQQRI